MIENVIQINGGIMINADTSVKNAMYVKKIVFGILLHVVVKNGKYLASNMDYSVIMCDEIIESYNKEINIIEKNAICETKSFYILFAFSLFTIVLLIAVSIYCYLIKLPAKQKHK